MLGVLAMLGPGVAAAQRGEAEALFARGVAAARDGEWERARELFTEADARLTHPNIRINLAAALVQTGRLRDAAELYARILEEHGEALGDRADEVRAALATVEGRLARLEIRLEGAQAGDQLAIDDEPVELDGDRAETRADPGSHAIEVRRGPETIAQRRVQLSEGERLSVMIPLEVPPEAPRPATELASGAPRATEPNWLAIGLLGGGALALAGVLYPAIRIADIQGSEEFAAYRDMYDEDVAICGDSVPRVPGLVAICDEAGALYTAEWVLIAVGGAAVIAGGVLMLVLGPELEVGPSARVRPVLGPGLAAITLDVAVDR